MSEISSLQKNIQESLTSNNTSVENLEVQDMFDVIDHTYANSGSSVVNDNNSDVDSNISSNQQNLATGKTSIAQKLLLIMMVVIVALTVGLGLFWYYDSVLKARVVVGNQEKSSVGTENADVRAVNSNNPTLTENNLNTQDPKTVTPPTNIIFPIVVPTPEVVPVEPIKPIVTVDADLDTDGDGLKDTREIELGTDIKRVDSDGDLLTDREEVLIYKTDPLDSDSDGDGYNDGVEVRSGYNPKGSGMLLPTLPNSQ